MKWQAAFSTTLLEALAKKNSSTSRGRLKSWVKQGRVMVNGALENRGDTIVQTGDTVEIQKRKKFLPDGLELVYEDTDIVVLIKPAGLLSVALDHGTQKNVHAHVKRLYIGQRIGVVHRLDRETSGLLLFAKTPRALKQLKIDFAAHAVKREYLAVVEGKIEQPRGVWHSYLAENSRCQVYTTTSEYGRQAVTHFECLHSNDRHSLLHLRLETGRKNQIRVHCQEAGYPVVGDQKYGAKTNPAKRVCLHAVSLTLKHPVTGKPLHFCAPEPKIFREIVKPHPQECTQTTHG